MTGHQHLYATLVKSRARMALFGLVNIAGYIGENKKNGIITGWHTLAIGRLLVNT